MDQGPSRDVDNPFYFNDTGNETVTPEQLRAKFSYWSLGDNIKLLSALQNLSEDLITKSEEIYKKLDDLHHGTEIRSVGVKNLINEFSMLADSQFIENRTYDEEPADSTLENNNEVVEDSKEGGEKSPDQQILPIIHECIANNLRFIEANFTFSDKVLNNQLESDEEEDFIKETLSKAFESNPYSQVPLPDIIGSQQYFNKSIFKNAENGVFDASNFPLEAGEDARDEYASEPSDDDLNEEADLFKPYGEDDTQSISTRSTQSGRPNALFVDDNDDDDLFVITKQQEQKKRVLSNAFNVSVNPDIGSINRQERKNSVNEKEPSELVFEDDEDDEDLFDIGKQLEQEKHQTHKPSFLKTNNLFEDDEDDEDLFAISKQREQKKQQTEKNTLPKLDEHTNTPKLIPNVEKKSEKEDANLPKFYTDDDAQSISSHSTHSTRPNALVDHDDNDDDDDLFVINKQQEPKKQQSYLPNFVKTNNLFEDDEDDEDLFSISKQLEQKKQQKEEKEPPKPAKRKSIPKTMENVSSISEKEDEDLFKPNTKDNIQSISIQSTKSGNPNTLFEDDEDDDDLFAIGKQQKQETLQTHKPSFVKAGSLFEDDEDDEDLFTTDKQLEQKKQQIEEKEPPKPAKRKNIPKTVQNTEEMNEKEDDDLFQLYAEKLSQSVSTQGTQLENDSLSSPFNSVAGSNISFINKQEYESKKENKELLFDDSEDDDDLFTINKQLEKKEQQIEEKEPPKPAERKSIQKTVQNIEKVSEKEDDDDLFAIVKQPEQKKQQTPKSYFYKANDLFEDDDSDDDLFVIGKQREYKKNLPEEKEPPKPAKRKNIPKTVQNIEKKSEKNDDDLFALFTDDDT